MTVMRALAALANFAGHLAAAQALVVAVVLLWAGLWKATVPRARAQARRSALARILRGDQQAVLAHVALGVSEMSVAILLLALHLRACWQWRSPPCSRSDSSAT
jgi:predicted lysophospholipase L1 biosynthesis ABC-type transport system permease subunit